MLIYQEDAGRGNSGKLPSGGVLTPMADASSMSVAVANPITFYGGVWPQVVISQSGQSGDLYNYYWTSYSRGMDGRINNTKWHNLYLDSYIPLRYKSIYDPCPYGYRIPSNGTYNQFTANAGWIQFSYIGGIVFNNSWFAGLGLKTYQFVNIGRGGWYYTSTSQTYFQAYLACIYFEGYTMVNGGNNHEKDRAHTVRCIEECELLPDVGEITGVTLTFERYDSVD